MKFLLILLVLPAVSLAQTIRIADNNPNAPAGANIYTGASALQNAINAAAAGDIVFIQPSITNYGNATIGKRITLKGVGFNIPELGARSSTVTNLTIVNSIDGIQNVSNTVLTGFTFNNITIAAGTGSAEYNNLTIDAVVGTSINHVACVPNINGLVIRNSFINNMQIGSCSWLTNVQVYNNIFDGSLDLRRSGDLVITNNLFYKSGGNSITAGLSTLVRVEHNVFSGSGAAFGELVSAVANNNIFFGTTPAGGSSGFYDNTFSNNLILNSFTMPPTANGGGPNSGVNNIIGVSPQFTNAGVTTTWAASVAFNYTLAAGSPCINAASTGDNIGPSGGTHPFTTTLTFKATAMPLITQFSNSGMVPQNQPLISNIKARSN